MLPFDPLDFDRHGAILCRSLLVDADEAAATNYVDAVDRFVQTKHPTDPRAIEGVKRLRTLLEAGKAVAALSEDDRALVFKWADAF